MSKKNNEIIKLGTIVLSNRVVVSDPCYGRGVACMKDNIYIKQGKYLSYAVKSDQEKFGDRIACIACIQEQYFDCFKKLQKINWCILDDNIGVDSCQAGIFDNSIYPENREFDKPIAYDAFYDECHQITFNAQQCGILKNKKGIVSTSGYGDGFYELKVLKEDDAVIALMIDFDVISHQLIIDTLGQI